MLGLGHRRIALISGSRQLTTVADRLEGVHESLRGAGIDPDSVPVLEAAFTREGGRKCTLRLLETHPETTAAVAHNDDMAIGCLSALRAAGWAVTGRMSVTGFDDVAVAGDPFLGLATVRLPMAEMGGGRSGWP